MKKIIVFLIGIVSLLIASCSSKSEYIEVEPINTKVNTTKTVGYNEARRFSYSYQLVF